MIPDLTAHAKQRAEEMGVSLDEIRDCYTDPDRDYPQGKYPGQNVRTKGRLALPYDRYTGQVITVLWNMPKGERFKRS